MKTLLSLLLIGILGIQCASPPEKLRNTEKLPQIIFVPGYYGSYLKRVDDDKRVWFGVGDALWGNQTLALKDERLQIPGAVDLAVDGVFRSLGWIGIYGNIIDSLEEKFSGRANIVPFAYDWRRDITQSSRQLARLVENLYARGAPKVAIVAHSMGGLVSSYYLLYGKQKLENAKPDLSGANQLHAVVMAATPFKGTMSIFYDMQYGVPFGLNRKALENAAVSSFPSSYQLLPQYPESLLSGNGENLSHWIFDEDRWQSHDWSLFRNAEKLNPATRLKRRKYTQKMLLLGKTTHQKIHDHKTKLNSGVPFLYLLSGETRTIHQAIWHEEDRTLLFPERNFDPSRYRYDEKKFLSRGDGTVSEKSAQPPEAFLTTFPNLQVRTRGEEHLELLQEETAIEEIAQFLQKALQL